jgi:hypothetical protein
LRRFAAEAWPFAQQQYLNEFDQEKAEQCFVIGLEDGVNNNSIFKEWARFWAQRMIVQSAIRMMLRGPTTPACFFSVSIRSRAPGRKRGLRVGKQLTFLTFNTTSRSMSSNALYLNK